MQSKVEVKEERFDTDQHQSLMINAHLIEHQELVQLYIHEDSLAWRLNFGFLTMNGALITIVYTLGIFNVSIARTSGIGIILVVAFILNISAFFTFHRSNIHLHSRLNRCYQLEDKLKDMGIEFQTLSSGERKIHDGKIIEKDKIEKLRWWEKFKVLKLRFSPPIVMSIFWLAILLWIILDRPLLAL